MARPKPGSRAGSAAAGQGRPKLALAFIAFLILALYAAMFITGHTTPRLGIDLAGGTSVTLTARPAPGTKGEITADSMNRAVEIIRQRVNAFGVSEAEVTVQGTRNIIVNVPGATQGDVVKQVGRTALLYFRPVLLAEDSGVSQTPGMPAPGVTLPPGAVSPAPSVSPSPSTSPAQNRVLPEALTQTPAPSPTGAAVSPSPSPGASTPAALPGVTPELQKQFAALDCTKPEDRRSGQPEDPAQPTVACSEDGLEKFVLGPAVIKGTELSKASAVLQSQQGVIGGWVIDFSLTDQGSKQFADITTKLAQYPQGSPQRRFAIELDHLVISAPNVNEPITGGNGQISGSFTQKSAQDLANVLKYGALPLAFEQSEVSQVSAILGGDQLKGGLIAGAIGLALVVIYSILYYRGLALVSIASLAVAAALTYAIAVLLGPILGFTLTLAGVAGLIVAIGITADSFIVFFERLRDEVRDGRTLRAAVRSGWTRARRTILVADFVSFLAAAVLYVVSVGTVKGFAFTLGLTTLLDVLVVFLFTKPLVTLLAGTRFFGGGHRWSGLDPEHLGVNALPVPTASRRRSAAGPKEA